MKKWEYKTIYEGSDKIINDLGAEGWEIATMVAWTDGDWSLILKREI